MRLIVEASVLPEADLIESATRVYEGLSDKEISASEKIASDRGDFFSDRTRQ